MRLAERHLGAIREMVQRGMPRQLVDSARVKAKMTFQLLRVEDAKQPDVQSRLTAPLLALRSPQTLLATRLLSTARVVVRQADERAPNQKLDVYGEVEVTYKTVL
jgi:predicted RNA-binding protein